MIQSLHLQRGCWSTEDLVFIQQRLAQSYPNMGPALRNAIVLLSMDEVGPGEGRDALQQRAASFALHCPTTDLSQMLAS